MPYDLVVLVVVVVFTIRRFECPFEKPLQSRILLLVWSVAVMFWAFRHGMIWVGLLASVPASWAFFYSIKFADACYWRSVKETQES